MTVTDVLPAGSAFVSATPAANCSGSSTIICDVGTLNVGASTTITLVIAAPVAGGVIVNTASVSAAESDPNPGNNSATATVTLMPASAIPTLSLSMLLLLAALLAAIAMIKLR